MSADDDPLAPAVSSSLHWLDTAARVLCCEWVDRRGRDGWCETHDDPWPCGRAQEAADVLAEDVAEVTGRLEALSDRLAAAFALVWYDAHPAYGNTAGWRGGIGGQAITWSCSVIDPPPGHEWLEADLPSGPLREWALERGARLPALKDELRREWHKALNPGAERGEQR